jgi:hypothetical protein
MKTQNKLWAALERLQSRFAKVAMSTRLEGVRRRGIKPALIRSKDRVSLRIYKERNHRLPHFHIEFKKQYAASYNIATGDRLAGSLPSKYEREMLDWARSNSDLLLREWNALNHGDAIQLTLECSQS